MSVKSGQELSGTVVTSNPTTGAAADATGTPTATLYVNGAAHAATVTVTKPTGTGIYKWAVTLPTLTAGDTVSIHFAATVATVAGAGVVFEDVADTARISEVAATVDSGTHGNAALKTILDTSGVKVLTNADKTGYALAVAPLDATATQAAAAAALDADPELEFIYQSIRNKQVDNGTTVVLYDDDGTTPLGSWTWTEATGTRDEFEVST